MSPALTQSELFTLLSAGKTVVLPHANAARTLRARFQAHLQHAPSAAADPGSVLAWQQWTASLWYALILEGQEDRLLLNHLQEEQLWAEIIAAQPSPGSQSLHTPDDLTALARSALHLAAAYNAVDRLRPAADSFDTRTFAAWLEAFRDHCRRQRLLSASLLDQALSSHLRAGSLRPPGPIYLVGFEDLTPSQRDLITGLQRGGIEVNSHSLVHGGPTRQVFNTTSPNPREELQLAASLIAAHSRKQIAEPQTFAVLLPNLQDRRTELDRLFREMLTPELEPIHADLSSTPWHFSSQPPVSTASVVANALEVLRWTVEPLSTVRIGHILLSPYMQFSEPIEARAGFEARALRNPRLLRPEFTLGSFLHFVSQQNHAQTKFPELRALHQSVERDRLHQGARSHAEWADRIRTLLRTAGWPGPRSLTAAEFSATEAWETLLDLISTLSATARRVTFASFFQQLEREARNATLPSLAANVPVQILTLTESDGIVFDHTLVLDATDTNLPAPERLHPLLPRHLQATLNMPGADPARTYERIRDRLQQLAARSGSLHLLAPAADETGPVRLTPLARELDCTPMHFEALVPFSADPEPIPLIEMPDDAQLPPLPSNHIRGGARVLELQAGCGFRAFATFRLAIGELSEIHLGLDPREAGSRLHKALEILWANLGDQATLRALSTEGRKAAVQTAVRAALRPLHPTPATPAPWSQTFLRVLEVRYTSLLVRWLNCELERSPFTILATEQERTFTIGPLELTLRLDRIDQVDGGQVFIDYKTAYTLSSDHWLGPRPDAPQLPLYTLTAAADDLRGVAFARVRPDKDIGWISLADVVGVFPRNAKNPQHDLTAEREAWQAELTAVAEAFAEGQTYVDPKSYPETCKFCAHRLLCRLDPTTLLSQSAEEDLPEDDLNG